MDVLNAKPQRRSRSMDMKTHPNREGHAAHRRSTPQAADALKESVCRMAVSDQPPHVNIDEAASRLGVSAKMVRHYESLGLLPQVDRTDAGCRQYAPERSAHVALHSSRARTGFQHVPDRGLIEAVAEPAARQRTRETHCAVARCRPGPAHGRNGRDEADARSPGRLLPRRREPGVSHPRRVGGVTRRGRRLGAL